MQNFVRKFGLLFLILLPFQAWAEEVVIRDAIAQKGYFLQNGDKKECYEDTKLSGVWDFCGCEAAVNYPVFSGLKNSDAQSKLNDFFAHEVKKHECEGKKATKSKKMQKLSPSERKISFKESFRSGHYLSVVQEWQEENAGAVHGMDGTIGRIIDTDSGLVLDNKMIFGADDKSYEKLNEFIFDVLVHKSNTFAYAHAQADGGEMKVLSSSFTTNVFVAADKCGADENKNSGCSLYIDKNGRLKIVFAPYEVASFADGIIEFEIPKIFVTNQALASILRE